MRFHSLAGSTLLATRKCQFAAQIAALAMGVACSGEQGSSDEVAAEDTRKSTSGITGGTLLGNSGLPWSSVVKLGWCSGLKVAARWYLTAHHCVYQPGQSITVTNSESGSGGTPHTISTVVVHPTVAQPLSAGMYGFDLALLELDGDNAIPAYWPTYSPQPYNVLGITTGYGCDATGANGGKKQFASVTARPFGDPAARASVFIEQDAGKEVCMGDSGGPFFKFNTTGTAYTLSGLNSLWGTDSTFARINPAREWVEAVRTGSPGKNDLSNLNNGSFINEMLNRCLRIGAPATIEQCGMMEDTFQRFRVEVFGDEMQFRNSNGFCLGIAGRSLSNGFQVTNSTCDESSNTRWRLRQTTGDFRQYQNVRSGKCMRISGELGAPIVQHTCLNTTDQFWIFTD